MVDGVKISELNPNLTAALDFYVPATKDGVTYQMSFSQIVGLAVAALTDSAPATLDTLNELAAALGDDPNFAATIASQLSSIEGDITSLEATVGGLVNVPTGTTVVVRGTTAPTGFIKENGASLSRTTYAALWAYAQASGNLAASEGAKQKGQFGPGNGSTTFTIPDSRGIFLRGWDDGAGLDTGRVFGTYQEDAFQGHIHNVPNLPLNPNSAPAGPDANGYGSTTKPTTGPVTDGTNGTPRTANETRGKNAAVLFCLKY